jgi:hypothetical protein
LALSIKPSRHSSSAARIECSRSSELITTVLP